MKVLIVDSTLSGKLIGGAQTFLVKLIGGLQSRGHEVHLVAGGEPNERVAYDLSATGVRVHTERWSMRGIVSDVTPALAKELNAQKPDIYVVSVSPDFGWTVLPHLHPNTPTLMIGHSDSRAFYDPLRHYSRFITTAIGVSEEICRQYTDYCGVPRENVVWIPYGVEAADEPPAIDGSPGILRLAFVGRLTGFHKRASDLIKISHRLADIGVDFRFDVVGDGELLPDFHRELHQQISDGRVYLHGWSSGKRVLELLRASHIFLLTSDSEGFCIALTEAMANGCCPIVTDIPSGNKQLVNDGLNGFIVQIGDIDLFVDRIKTLNNDRDLLARMRTAAWETGREYSVERMVDNYVACFERAIEDARSNPRIPDPTFPLMESCRSKYPLWLRRLKARVVSGKW